MVATLSAVWRMHDADERDASLALRSSHGNRLRSALHWYRTQGRLHTGDPIAMATDALTAYECARNAGKDALLVCDTWEIADALNKRLHDTHTSTAQPTVKAAREQDVTVGDLIMSRTNDATIALRPAPNRDVPTERVDKVRNGNRWRVAAVDPERNRLAAERLSDGARVVFDGDYLREHITLGYAATVHAAQGVTADASYAILGAHASRAMAYVAMTRGRQTNEAFLYQSVTGEADHQHTPPVTEPEIHTLRRGNTYSAAHHFRQILARDERPHTMHHHAAHTPAQHLPTEIAELLDRNEARRIRRGALWREQAARVRRNRDGYKHATTAFTAAREASFEADGLEL
jgi:hypothetical protein